MLFATSNTGAVSFLYALRRDRRWDPIRGAGAVTCDDVLPAHILRSGRLAALWTTLSRMASVLVSDLHG